MRILTPMVLIGYRGSGKTTVGQLLAERLNKPFADTDMRIVERSGMTIREIFAIDGESSFRDLEAAAVTEIAPNRDHVIALGGGALGRPQNLTAIESAGHPIIYLRCEPQELLRRIKADPQSASARPPLSKLGGGLAEIEKILAEREPLWERVMSHKIDVTKLTPQQVVDAIVRLV